jgi:hypothetical protein
MQRLQVREVQRSEILVLEKICRFVEVKAQGRRVDLKQLIVGAQPSKRKRWLRARHKHEMEIRRGVSQ